MIVNEGGEFQLYRKGDLAYLQAPLLSDSCLVDHAFSTRLGGCSSGAMSWLNTAFHTGDQVKHVLENRRRFMDSFGYDYKGMVSCIQVHGTDMAVFNNSHRGEGAQPDTGQQTCDALITEEPGLVLSAYAADCMLIYVVSTRKPLIALAHAGWRGTLGNIGGKVVRYLQQRYLIEPDQLLVALSPAICAQCYQVDETVAAQFRAAGWDNPTCLTPGSAEGAYHLDLALINSQQLLQAGIRPRNLAYNHWCTACNPELFYSYRLGKGITGRMIGFLA
ncbi:MAG TPA: peptidoglycan editing factor PgeF, partial [Candidatus Limnocylindrales bacterium]|nr:peptidoglycan editing factor PgeF [Candidatus Limnocylindrales bacterium]